MIPWPNSTEANISYAGPAFAGLVTANSFRRGFRVGHTSLEQQLVAPKLQAETNGSALVRQTAHAFMLGDRITRMLIIGGIIFLMIAFILPTKDRFVMNSGGQNQVITRHDNPKIY